MTGDVRVVGTAHISSTSASRVREVIREERPDVVAVELDRGRYERLREFADKRGYGVDMRAAVEEAERLGVPVALIDRDVHVTARRLWNAMSLFERVKMAFSLVAAFLGLAGVRDVEEVLENDGVEEYVERLRDLSPGAAEVLIDERDAVMAGRLVDLRERGLDVVAVVGAGHERGVRSYVEDPDSIPGVPNRVMADVYEGGGEVVVVLDLPGCVEGSIDVELRGEVLVVTAETERFGGEVLVEERPGRVCAEAEVPGGLGLEDWGYGDGVLEVRLGKQRGIELL